MKLNRRSMLKNSGVLGATLLGPGLPLWSMPAEALAQTAANTTYLELSSALTGLDTDVLDPTISQDGMSLSDLYRSVCLLASPSTLTQLEMQFEAYVSAGASPQQIGDELLGGSSARTDGVGTLARLTMFMWMFGVWYGETEVTNMPQAAGYLDADYQADFVVSSRAYANGWIWRFAQAHPMGSSNFNFGSWADQPPDLADYVN